MTSAGFVPCLINEENHAVPLQPTSDDGQTVVHYMDLISEAACLRTRYELGSRQVGGYQVVTAAAR
jgi:hypothetical protein